MGDEIEVRVDLPDPVPVVAEPPIVVHVDAPIVPPSAPVIVEHHEDVEAHGIHPDVAAQMVDSERERAELRAEIDRLNGELSSTANIADSASATATDALNSIDTAIEEVAAAGDRIISSLPDAIPSPELDIRPKRGSRWFARR